ncbi:phenylacetate--CoA ligase family protein [Streptomyces sp. NPDC056909]|uniref:phenylacetate--CoA ligase family protein n=1 Tax=Streptomyces sp. NPDC056909 TaxID=3345963 RepID=UPI0036996811
MAPGGPSHGPSGIELAENLDTLSRARLEEIQQRNLAVTVNALRENPRVAASWPGALDLRVARDLLKLPLFSPADLQETCPPASENLVLGDASSGLVLRSSGTSGLRKMIYHSWQFSRRVSYLGARGVRAALRPRPRRVANFLYPAELNGAFGFAQEVTELLPAMAFPMGSSALASAETPEVLRDHRVDTVICSPSAGTQLLTGDSTRELLRCVTNFLYIGEILGESRERRLDEIRPDLTVRSFSYSTSETGPIGYQCAYQSGSTHHLHEDVLVVEVIDTDAERIQPDGRVGEVVVTTLTDSGMPLLRYQVGDEGYIETEPCLCGSAARQLTLTGRVGQSMNVDSTTISRDLVMERLGTLGITDPADCQFQVVQHDPGFSIRLLLSDRTPAGVTAEDAVAALYGAYHMGRVFTAPSYRGLTLERVDGSAFHHTARGKTPFFVERSAG